MHGTGVGTIANEQPRSVDLAGASRTVRKVPAPQPRSPGEVFYAHFTADGAIFVVRADGSQDWLTAAQLDNELRAVADVGGRFLYSRADTMAAAGRDASRPAPIVTRLVERVRKHELPIKEVDQPHPSVAKPLEGGTTMLMAFASKGRIGLIDDLLIRGASPDQADEVGGTALMYAANSGNEPVVQCLLDHGADVNAHDGEGNVALMFAAQSGHERVVRRLIQAGADPTVRGQHGLTALGFARESGDAATVEALAAAGAPE